MACPQSPHRYKLEHDKVYRFMHYVVFREKRKAGKRRDVRFDREEFDRLEAEANRGEFPDPTKPTGVSTFDQCKAVIKRMCDDETSQNATSHPWNAI